MAVCADATDTISRKGTVGSSRLLPMDSCATVCFQVVCMSQSNIVPGMEAQTLSTPQHDIISLKFLICPSVEFVTYIYVIISMQELYAFQFKMTFIPLPPERSEVGIKDTVPWWMCVDRTCMVCHKSSLFQF